MEHEPRYTPTGAFSPHRRGSYGLMELWHNRVRKVSKMRHWAHNCPVCREYLGIPVRVGVFDSPESAGAGGGAGADPARVGRFDSPESGPRGGVGRMVSTEELKARAWKIATDTGTHSKRGVVRKVERRRLPMSAEKFRTVLQILGWSGNRTKRELGVCNTTVARWRTGRIPVPRRTELALMFCLIRDKPSQIKEISERLAKMD